MITDRGRLVAVPGRLVVDGTVRQILRGHRVGIGVRPGLGGLGRNVARGGRAGFEQPSGNSAGFHRRSDIRYQGIRQRDAGQHLVAVVPEHHGVGDNLAHRGVGRLVRGLADGHRRVVGYVDDPVPLALDSFDVKGIRTIQHQAGDWDAPDFPVVVRAALVGVIVIVVDGNRLIRVEWLVHWLSADAVNLHHLDVVAGVLRDGEVYVRDPSVGVQPNSPRSGEIVGGCVEQLIRVHIAVRGVHPRRQREVGDDVEFYKPFHERCHGKGRREHQDGQQGRDLPHKGFFHRVPPVLDWWSHCPSACVAVIGRQQGMPAPLRGRRASRLPIPYPRPR